MIIQLTVAWMNETKDYWIRASTDHTSSPHVRSPDRITIHLVRTVESEADLRGLINRFDEALRHRGWTRATIRNHDDLEEFISRQLTVLTERLTETNQP